MPDQDPDLPDPDEWLENFKASLNEISRRLYLSTAPADVPGLLGSREELEAIAREVNGRPDPAVSVTASAARSLPGAPGALPYHAVPSPHAGHYPTLDEAAKAAANDVPRNPYVEYGAFLPQRQITEDIDLGDGFGPQSISHVDGYDYGGLYTSGNPIHVSLGQPPAHLGAWFHNHPWDSIDSINEQNKAPSSGRGNDWDFVNELHKANPLMETYILGPDGVLRKFLLPGDRGEIVK